MSDSTEDPYGTVRNAVVLVRDGLIDWVGAASDAPEGVIASAREDIDLGGGWVTPGLIDAHTHLVFGGTRAGEWERRLGGASYEDIARAGGGILSTVRATRSASLDDLVLGARSRLETMIDFGTTTVEIKSGYGLEPEAELRMLEAARTLGNTGVSVSTTLLGAHALPPEFQGDRAGYIDLVCDEMIPRAADGLADAVDAFCEGIGFTPEECTRVLEAGAAHGLAGRLHADQLSDLEGAALAARMGARSADHLEYTNEAGAEAMAAAGCAAVLLPGAFYFLQETRKPPIEAFREYGVPLVVATDSNPGSSPTTHPLVAMNQACVLFGLTPAEALAGMTRLAGPVLGLDDRGVIEAGRRADLACWAVGSPAELSYWMGGTPAMAVIADGRRLR
ncbi:MAG: imidazolonepropionase [Gemmatimonadota bacterium]|nr:imidazolonepropionase [Gemmatimonadota bacterium]MDE3004495.1 imidazolonepropionase [Gemmatimonadota bacterium]MDE3013857.1 imidazolonepropionase [Gemmatimonadota bacterium]